MTRFAPRYSLWARQWEKLGELVLVAEKYGWTVESYPGKFGSEIVKATSRGTTITVVFIPKILDDEADATTTKSQRLPRPTYNIERPGEPKHRISAHKAMSIIKS